MNVNEKAQFIENLIDAVRKDVLSKVFDLPEEWDGHELRRYIADKFEDASITLKRGQRRRVGDESYRRRLKDYENEVIVRNL